MPTADEATARPAAPMPTRPKGRLVIGGMLLAVCLSVLFSVWDVLARTAVYGVVEGRVVHLSPEWSGVVESTHVREGDEVRQGQLLLTVRSLELKNELAKIGDQLRLAQAQLEAQLAQMRWQAEQRDDRSQVAASEYYELWSDLAKARGELQEKQAFCERLQRANSQTPGAVGDHEREAASIAAGAATEHVQRLTEALDKARQRSAAYRDSSRDVQLQFQPQVALVESLQAEWERVRKMLDRAELRSPCNGRVAKVLRYSGEYAHKGDAVVEVVEHGSLEAVLFVPQEQAGRIVPGDHVHVHVSPNPGAVPCEVIACGSRLEDAPPSIRRYYNANEPLLPVRLRPLPGRPHVDDWRQGSRVRVPWDAVQTPSERTQVTSRNVSA
ncbi:MAG: efflux RND transporter periplasmic adaptor subunit [Planctomycetales bacterium]|nr:efflux RND transporter periplasmic adaptor subunit [Planctomycetales bacterium]